MEYAVLIISYAWKKNWCWHLCCKIVVMGPSLQFIFVKFILYILQQLNNPCTVNRQNSQKYWDSWPSNCWAHTAHHMHINHNDARTSLAKYSHILIPSHPFFSLHLLREQIHFLHFFFWLLESVNIYVPTHYSISSIKISQWAFASLYSFLLISLVATADSSPFIKLKLRMGGSDLKHYTCI